MKTLKTTTATSMLTNAVMILISAVSIAGQKSGDDKATSKNVKHETMEAIETIKKYLGFRYVNTRITANARRTGVFATE